MIRLTFYISLAVIIALAAAWVSSNPGQILMTWQGWEIRFSITVFAALIILYSLGILATLYLLKWLNITSYFTNPKRLAKKRAKAQSDLDHGWSALALGDHQEALKYARRAKAKIGEDHDILRLLARATKDVGDKDNPYFKILMTSPEAVPWVEKQHLDILLEQKSWPQALILVEKMLRTHPKNALLIKLNFFLTARLGKWQAAQNKLLLAIKEKAIENSDQGHLKAVINYCQALEEKARGQKAQSMDLLKSALKNDPYFSPAALLTARLYLEQDDKASAEKALKNIWKISPNKEISDLIEDLYPNESSTEAFLRIKKITDTASEFTESHHLLAKVAIKAKHWPEARNALESTLNSAKANKTTYQLLALLERKQKNDESAAEKFIEMSEKAPTENHWTCTSCHNIENHFLPICPNCQEFDTVKWPVFQ